MTEPRPNPADIAREVFRQLAQSRKPPTPENYARAYARQAGVAFGEVMPAAAVLEHVAKTLVADTHNADFATELRAAVDEGQWVVVERILKAQLARASVAASASALTVRSARDGSPQRDAIDGLRDVLGKTIEFLVDERLGYSAAVVREAHTLFEAVRGAMNSSEIDHATGRLRHFWLDLELRGEGPEAMIRGLHDLVRLMVRNMGDLVVDDQWVKGQVERIQKLLDQPLNAELLHETQRSYRDFVFRQGTVKFKIDEATQAIRALTALLVDRLGEVAASTGEFSGELSHYSEQIRASDSLPAISGVLERLIARTQNMHVAMNATHKELAGARDRVLDYEAHVRALQAELSQMSERIREDALTGALNRRGLEQQYALEQSRADRRAAPVCLAVLDVDNFRLLNERLGHVAGDEALKHLSKVVRDTLRPTDSLARYGGEEFVILMPDTEPADAERAMIRVQRELTKRFFLHNNERVLITFSAGISSRRPGEPQEPLVDRATRAMAEAKSAGKNRVQRAQDD